jgi:hypothetical protein
MEIIANVIEKCDKELHQTQILSLINKATERVVVYMGKYQSSVLRIGRKQK